MNRKQKRRLYRNLRSSVTDVLTRAGSVGSREFTFDMFHNAGILRSLSAMGSLYLGDLSVAARYMNEAAKNFESAAECDIHHSSGYESRFDFAGAHKKFSSAIRHKAARRKLAAKRAEQSTLNNWRFWTWV